MTNLHLKPMAIALSLALSLSACGKHEAATDTSAPAKSSSAMPARAASVAAAPVAKRPFDVSELDNTIAACQDFNGFVNAKWVAANPIPQDRSGWGAYDALAESSLNTQHEIVDAANQGADRGQAGSIEQKIGWFYRSGMNEDAINKAGFEPIKPQLDAIGKLKSSADVVDYIDRSFSEGEQPLFNFGASPDYQDATMQIGYASQGGLGLPTKDYYSEPKYADIRAAYVAYIVTSLQLVGVPADDAKAQADEVMKFETQLAHASLSPEQQRDLKNQYHYLTLAQADKVTPHFSWQAFFSAQDLAGVKGFSLSQPKFFAQLDNLLAGTPVTQWQAYLRFHAIDGAANDLSEDFQQAKFAFYGQALSGQPQQKLRWKRVLATVNGDMGEALGQLYVAKMFTAEAKQRAEVLVDNVRNALKARIEKLDWMSADTKAKAIAKWDTFLPKIGYPEKWRDWSGLEIKPGDYYANVKAAVKFNYRYDIAHIGQRTDRKEWSMTPQTVNAYYNASDNTINFPAAILQPPFFDASADDAINYGGIGAVIGHEASHGFDDEGSQFDGAGNNKNWWSKGDRAQFEARTDQLVRQFNEYAPIKDHPELHANGQLTLGENIADLGGLNVAYDALQAALQKSPNDAAKQIDGYTQEQRFFLNWARIYRSSMREKKALLYLSTNVHASPSLRVIGAPSNMQAFAAAFQCKPGDAMVRPAEQQVKIW
ncbi:M13 family metallopeptidase [Dyella silvatica]|uniref:M13 family metallopeptidase n=1 Tax=Dyella silvatica TaxID=2992128 RepID=UPI00225BB1A1|nr:M13 family metallopeptidase [Dyella silvatica]